MGCFHEFCFVVSTGPNRTGAVVWSLRRKVTTCGCFFALGMWTPSEAFAWQHWIATLAIFIRKFQHWVGWWMNWGLTFRWHQLAVAQPSLWKPSVNICGYRQKLIDYPVFDLRMFRRWLQRTASSVFGSLDGLAMTNSSSIGWKVLKHVIGCRLAPPWKGPSWPTTWVFHILLTLLPTSSAFGPWLSLIWRRRVAKTMALVLW